MPTAAGLSPQFSSRNQIWIIVGTVLGFAGGVVIGIIVVILLRQVRLGNRRKTFDLTRSCEITNETSGSLDHHKNRGMALSGSGSAVVGGAINNSNNFTRSGNDYNPHAPPPHIRIPTTPLKHHGKNPPCKEGTKTVDDVDGPPTVVPRKKCASATPPTATPPPSAGCKNQGSIFTFHPSSIHTTNTSSLSSSSSSSSSTTPPPPGKSVSYSRSMSGASAYSETGTLRVSTEKPAHSDPNFLLNYKAKVNVTDEQKKVYGRNILSRQPSVDGSKTKYYLGDGGGSRNSTTSSGYESGSLPRSAYRYHAPRRDVVQLDAELGCSQC